LMAIDSIADHCEPCSFCCSNTIRTARSRTSGEYFVVFFMALSSQIAEPPVNPGGFTKVWTFLFLPTTVFSVLPSRFSSDTHTERCRLPCGR
jgi:hypothetical protein